MEKISLESGRNAYYRIVTGTMIFIYSAAPKAAMFNIFPFCMGMLLIYYAVAIVTDGVYNKIYIFGRMIFALCSPFLSYIAWMTKCRRIKIFLTVHKIIKSLDNIMTIFFFEIIDITEQTGQNLLVGRLLNK